MDYIKDVIIFTEDSQSISPFSPKKVKRKDVKNRLGHHPEIVNLLKNKGLDLPNDDNDMEARYRDVLAAYVRPASMTYAGPYLEVKIFKQELEKMKSTSLYVLSTRYGLIKDSKIILPYEGGFSDSIKIAELDHNKHLSRDMLKVAKNYRTAVFLLRKQIVNYLFDADWFSKLPDTQNIIIVSPTDIKSTPERHGLFLILPRKGLARIGKSNKKIIFDHICNIDK